MYLSCLLIDVGADPDRPRPGRLWLRNLYRVHQRLAMAFPSKECPRDPLGPNNPDHHPDQKAADDVLASRAHVHEERTDESGFLFRIDYGVEQKDDGRPPVVLVQSAKKPDWHYAFGLTPSPHGRKPVGNAGHLLAVPPQVREIVHDFPVGTKLRFRLNANPTRKLSTDPLAGKGKRLSVGRDPAAILDWLWRKAAAGGFEPVFGKGKDGWDDNWRVTTQLFYAWKSAGEEENSSAKMTFGGAMIDGILRVTDASIFAETLRCGVGSAKAFGFGLLTVAPVREDQQ